MILVKLGTYTCLFYLVLTALLEASFFLVNLHFNGLGVWGLRTKSLFWTVGAGLGALFGALWVISFFAAWCIVYAGLKSTLAGMGH
jgi:hypothetical protein